MKATPRPATSSMSRSLAPSPMATVRDEEGQTSGREATQRLPRLPGAVHDVAHQPAGEVAVDHFEAVGVGVVDPELVGEPFDDLDEPAGQQQQ